MTFYLHIGPPKAGSSTLQYFLEANAAALKAREVAMPRSASRFSHRRLKMYALDDGVIDNLRRSKGYTTPTRIEHFRRTFRERFLTEAASWPPEERVALTCEQLIYLDTPTARERLRELLQQAGRPVFVVLYPRRQDHLFLSQYVQRIRGGAIETLDEALRSVAGMVFAYDRVLADWAETFGAPSIIVRPFERAQLAGGGIVSDFMSLLGVSDLDQLTSVPDQNASLDSMAVEYLRLLNAHLPRWVDAETNQERKAVVAALETLSAGEKPRLSSLEAQALVAPFAEGNADVARRWLGRTDGVLFREPFDSRHALRPAIDLDQLVALTAQLTTRLGARRAP